MSKLILRSLIVLALLFGLLFAVGLMVMDYLEAPLWLAILFAVAVGSLQYLFSPAILNWLFRIRWVDPAALPHDLGAFVLALCAEQRIPVPRLGVIDDGNPNAFTFGHYPGDARVVVTSGLLDALSPEEAQTVLAHELGHVKHWDFVLMTVASLIPMILYTIYVGLRERDRKGISWAVGFGAYVAYLVSQLAVLFLSRVREYYADAFAAKVTGRPEDLSRALVKIAYGLTRNRLKPAKKPTKEERRATLLRQRLDAAGALGFSSGKAPSSFALAAVGAEGQGELVTRAMAWDLYNPWAKWLELFATHPLTAKRISALGGLPEAPVGGAAPRYGVRRFITDVVVKAVPAITLVWVFLVYAVRSERLDAGIGWEVFSFEVALWVGAAFLFTTFFRYRGGFRPAKIGDLIGEVIVSDIRPIPATIQGTVVGRGVPGLFFSEDLVMQDETGFIVLDYRQPWRLIETLFGVFRAERFIGQEVTAVGWYRRGVAPRFEVKYLQLSDGGRVRCLVYYFRLGLSALATAVGFLALLLG